MKCRKRLAAPPMAAIVSETADTKCGKLRPSRPPAAASGRDVRRPIPSLVFSVCFGVVRCFEGARPICPFLDIADFVAAVAGPSFFRGWSDWISSQGVLCALCDLLRLQRIACTCPWRLPPACTPVISCEFVKFGSAALRWTENRLQIQEQSA